LKFDKFPRALGLSQKIKKLGFNFFYDEQVANNTEFLKGRLERYIWSISPHVSGCRGGSCADESESGGSENDWMKIDIVQGVMYASNTDEKPARFGRRASSPSKPDKSSKRLFTSDDEISIGDFRTLFTQVFLAF
jgi:hypothetical protein